MPKQGFIYVLKNGSMAGLVKVGLTTRSPEERASELSCGTGIPSAFRVAYKHEVTDCDQVERLVHRELDEFRTSDNREFFEIGVDEAIEVVRKIAVQFEAGLCTEVDGQARIPDGLNKLMRACLASDAEAVDSLLAKGLNPNACTEDGVTALMMAAARGSGKIIDLLLQHGAKLDAVAKDGSTASSLAKERGQIFALNVLNYYKRGAHDLGKGQTKLANACARRNCAEIIALLKAGADPNEPCETGELPLEIAAASGASRVIGILLENGAKSGNAESIAESKGHFVTAALIRRHKEGS